MNEAAPALTQTLSIQPEHAPCIRVKLLSRFPAEIWRHQCPDGRCVWGGCCFSFEREDAAYDWLVVYDDIPPLPGQKRHLAVERLRCAPFHTLLVTTEPPSIKSYGRAYTRQFGTVLTSQPAWALPHPDRIFAQPALHWFYGVGSRSIRPFHTIAAMDTSAKDRGLSMVFSPKRMRHTLHHRRHTFMSRLMALLPEMEVYGSGARPLDDKAEALDPESVFIKVKTSHVSDLA